MLIVAAISLPPDESRGYNTTSAAHLPTSSSKNLTISGWFCCAAKKMAWQPVDVGAITCHVSTHHLPRQRMAHIV